MIKDKIENEELKRIFTVKCDLFEFDEITDEMLLNIKELELRANKFNGEDTEIDLSELEGLSLERLELNGFRITVEELEIIKKMKLKEISFNNCIFEYYELNSLDTVNELSIIGGENVDKLEINLPEKSLFVDVNIDFSKLNISNSIKISLLDCTIKNMSSLKEYDKLEYMILDGSQVFNEAGQKIENVDEILVDEKVLVSFDEMFVKANLD